MKIIARLAVAILLAAGLFSASPGSVQAQSAPGWLPPGLSNEERQEWKEGRPPGWSRGVKRGWRGKDCPPGLAKKGRCHPREVAVAPQGEQKKWEDQVREAIERLKKWGREKMKLSAPVLDAVLIGFEGAVRYGVPIETAERTVTAAAERGLSPYGIEAITRALAYGAERRAPLGDLESFAQQGLSRGAAAEAIALGIYRLAAESRR
jgi:hypothetical protein